MNGELPVLRHPTAVVLLVGTNDLRDAKIAAGALSAVKGDPATAALAVRAAAPDIADRYFEICGAAVSIEIHF